MWGFYLFCLGVCLRATENQAPNEESFASLDPLLPDATGQGRQKGGWLAHSRGNHKAMQLLRISKQPKDEAGSFEGLALDCFITYSQVYLGSIIIIAL